MPARPEAARRRWPHPPLLLALLLGGLGYWLWPVDRYEALDHTLGFMAVVEPVRPPPDWHTTLMPWPSWALARATGYAAEWAFGPGRGMEAWLFVSAMFGALFAWAWSRVAGQVAGVGAAWLALGLMVLEPVRLLWSHSAYHVVQPAAVLGVAVAVALGRSSAWQATVVAILTALAVVWRLEQVHVLPLCALLALHTRGRAGWSGALGLAVGGTAVFALRVFVTEEPGLSGWVGQIMARNAPFNLVETSPLWPWSGGALLALTALAAFVERRRLPRLLSLGLLWLVGWAALGTFDDFGDRHTLSLRGAGLTVLACAAARAERGDLPSRVAGALLALLLVAGSAVGGREAYRIYYAPAVPPAFTDGIESHEARRHGRHTLIQAVLADAEPELPRTCVVSGSVWIADGPRLAADGDQPSRILTGTLNTLRDCGVRYLLQRDSGCLVWLEAPWEQRWDDTMVLSRSRRLRRRFAWTPLRTPSHPDWRLWRLEPDEEHFGRLRSPLTRVWRRLRHRFEYLRCG